MLMIFFPFKRLCTKSSEKGTVMMLLFQHFHHFLNNYDLYMESLYIEKSKSTNKIQANFRGCPNNIVASCTKILQFWKIKNFTHEIWVTNDKLNQQAKIKKKV